MGLLEKIAARRNYPLTIGTQTIQICALEIDAFERIEALPPELKNSYMMGHGLCEDDGSPAFPQRPEESDAAYAARVQSALKDAGVRTDTLIEITRAIGMIGTVNREDIAKN